MRPVVVGKRQRNRRIPLCHCPGESGHAPAGGEGSAALLEVSWSRCLDSGVQETRAEVFEND